MGRLRTAVLISGRGSNMRALVAASQAAEFPAEIVTVISNRPDAAGLAHAARAGIAASIVDHKHFSGREDFEAALTAAIEEAEAELVCLAGFMRLLTAGFVDRWRDRLINIHPSLLPSYRGLDTHARVLADGVRFTGCTVHYVRAEMDDGPIVVQAAVPVHPGDDEAALAARVLEAEHRCYPLAVRLIAEGRVHVDGTRAIIDGAAAPLEFQINPTDV